MSYNVNSIHNNLESLVKQLNIINRKYDDVKNDRDKALECAIEQETLHNQVTALLNDERSSHAITAEERDAAILECRAAKALAADFEARLAEAEVQVQERDNIITKFAALLERGEKAIKRSDETAEKATQACNQAVSTAQGLAKELKETREELKETRGQVNDLTKEVNDLTEEVDDLNVRVTRIERVMGVAAENAIKGSLVGNVKQFGTFTAEAGYKAARTVFYCGTDQEKEDALRIFESVISSAFHASVCNAHWAFYPTQLTNAKAMEDFFNFGAEGYRELTNLMRKPVSPSVNTYKNNIVVYERNLQNAELDEGEEYSSTQCSSYLDFMRRQFDDYDRIVKKARSGGFSNSTDVRQALGIA